MPTNAETVLETTHSQVVHQHDPANNNFYPLPNFVVTPINVNKLSEYLVNHPDINFVNFLIDGFSNGFSIGYNGPLTPGQCQNLLSARSNPVDVSTAVLKEVNCCHTAGPFSSSLPFDMLHCSH